MAAGLNEASLALAGESRAVLPPDPADTTGEGADAGLILEYSSGLLVGKVRWVVFPKKQALESRAAAVGVAI